MAFTCCACMLFCIVHLCVAIRTFKHMSNSISYSYRDLKMVAALVCVAVVLGIYPADRTVWCVEMVWAVGLWAILLLTRRRTSSATPLARSALRDSSSGAIGEILFIGRTSFQMALQF